MDWALWDLTLSPGILTSRNMTWGPWARPRDTQITGRSSIVAQAPHVGKLLWLCILAAPPANIELGTTVPPSSGQTASQTTFTKPYPACSCCFLQLAHRSDLIVLVECWHSQNLFPHCFPWVIMQFFTISLLKDFSNSSGEIRTGRSLSYSGCWLPALVNPRSPCTLSTLDNVETLQVSGKTKISLTLEPGGTSCQLRTKNSSTIIIGHGSNWQRDNIPFI